MTFAVTMYEDVDQRDALLEVEGPGGPTVLLHLDPRTESVRTVELTVTQAWQLARELARAASAAENES